MLRSCMRSIRQSVLGSQIGPCRLLGASRFPEKESRATYCSDDRRHALEFIHQMTAFKKSMLASHIEFMPAPDAQTPPSTLVLLGGWLGAANHNLNKYVEIYHQRNIDVMRVLTRWVDLSFPTMTVVPNARKMVTGLSQLRLVYPNIIIHCLSSSGYFYASMVDVILRDPQHKATLSPHLKGLIFDCLASWLYVINSHESLDEILHPNLSRLAKEIVKWIGANDHRKVPYFQYFQKRADIIEENPLKLPTLQLFSSMDPVSTVDNNMRLVNKWQKAGIDVTHHCWADSPHVQLLRLHEEEYIKLVYAFLEKATMCQCNST